MSPSSQDLAKNTDIRRAIELARGAMEKIKQWRLPALPYVFEILFVYEQGDNSALVGAFDEILSGGKGISAARIDRLYARFIGGREIGDRINSTGLSLDIEVSQVSEAIDEAVHATHAYSTDVDDVKRSLKAITTTDGLKTAVGELIHVVVGLNAINVQLETRLKSSSQQIKNLQKSLKMIRLEAQTDSLTGLTNRRTLDLLLADHFRQFRELGNPLSFVMCDIDHFRNFNNSWGHLIGDQVLRLVSNTLRASFKGQDVVARYGGEEFAIVLPNTCMNDACAISEQVRRSVMSCHVRNRSTGEDMGRVTLSIGIAEARMTDTPETLIARADACLYSAKNTGRNRVISEIELDTRTILSA